MPSSIKPLFFKYPTTSLLLIEPSNTALYSLSESCVNNKADSKKE